MWAILALCLSDGGMASKGFRAISYQGTIKVEAAYNPTHTSETLKTITLVPCCFVFHGFFVLLCSNK